MKLKASSIYFALVVILISSFFLGALLQLFDLNQNLQFRLLKKRNDIENIEDAWQFGSHTKTNYIDGESQLIIRKDTVKLLKKNWGIFEQLLVKSNTDSTRLKIGLLTNVNKKDSVALQIGDRLSPLALAGNSQLVGTILTSDKAVKRATVGTEHFYGKELVNGKIQVVQEELPKISKRINESIQQLLMQIPSSVGKKSHQTFTKNLSNSFLNTIHVVSSETPIYIDKYIQGNVLVIAPKITISPNAKIEDVLIVANEILVESGSVVSCQLLAKKSIELQSNVELLYPSAICLLSKGESQLILHQRSLIEGVVLHDSSENSSKTNIQENVLIHGQLYSSAKTQLKGIIWGSSFVNSFYLQTPSTLYKNYLYNATLNRDKQSYYVKASVLENDEIKKRKAIKWLK